MPPRQRLRRVCLVIGALALSAAFALRVRARTAGEPFLPFTPEASRLRVLTWNVGKIYLGGRHDSRAADADLARIASVIREAGPDLVALQELRDRGQLEHLLGLLGGAYVGSVPDEEINDRRVAALVRQQPDVAFSQIVTSTGRAAEVARIMLGARSLTFVSLHLDAFDPALRATQAEEILDWAQRAEDRDLIIAGDFNFDADFLSATEPEHPDVRIYRLLTAHFQDVAGGGSGATTIVDRRLDYLFVRGRLRRRAVHVVEGRNMHLMDHMPVVADFEVASAL
ncbi:MAG TPA: endonuclease/exonuclease/phosphatase family protein [Polyangia bacterium]|nr:endonuclease/exonuclease/phosphatase family protein [Polyangia bacterium]